MNIKAKIIAVFAAVAITLSVTASAAMAKKNDDGMRPGWGWGDKNHQHTGPKGHSVFPGPSVHPRVEVETEQNVEVTTNGGQSQVVVMVRSFVRVLGGMFSKINVGSSIAVNTQ